MDGDRPAESESVESKNPSTRGYLWYVDNTCTRPHGFQSGRVWDALNKYSSPENPITRRNLRKKAKLTVREADQLSADGVRRGYFKRYSPGNDNDAPTHRNQPTTHKERWNTVDVTDLDIEVEADWKTMVHTIKEKSPHLYQIFTDACKSTFYMYARKAYNECQAAAKLEQELQKNWDEMSVYGREQNLDAVQECASNIRKIELQLGELRENHTFIND